MDVRWILFVVGAALIATAVAWPARATRRLGRLPGDIAIQRRSAQIYFPIVTCLVLSVVLSLLFWLIRK